MNAARRNHKRRDWPRGLYEPRAGYFIFRTKARKVYTIGTVPLAEAIRQAIEANAMEAGQAAPSLVEKMAGKTNTVAKLLDNMKDRPSADNTIRTRKSLDGIIRRELGEIECGALTTAHCADMLESIEDAGKKRSAAAVRTRLVEVCRRGVELGWLDKNPADFTRKSGTVPVKRGRLTLETFQAIYEAAPKVAPWLQRAMMIGLVLGADRITITGLQRTMVSADTLTYQRQKTGAWIAVPLDLRMDAVGVSLRDLVNARTGVLSPSLLHHTQAQGQAKRGAPVHPDTISQKFTDARTLAGIPDVTPDGKLAPTFHELRSLCKRTYMEQGGVDTKALLGHAGERVADKYADVRGVEPIRVKIA